VSKGVDIMNLALERLLAWLRTIITPEFCERDNVTCIFIPW